MTNEEYVRDLAKRNNASYEQSDTDKLDEYGRGADKYRELQNDPNADWNQAGVSSPDQYENFKKSLDAQYKQRGANSGGPAGGGTTTPPNGGGNTGGSTGGTVTQSWSQSDPALTAAMNAQTDLLRQQLTMQQQRQAAADAAEAERKGKADTLYGELMNRAQQNVTADPNTEAVKGQVDSYRAEQDRVQRNRMSDLAESAGPYENLRGEQRMAAEHTGQAVGGFQAELIAREIAARRAEVADALNGARGMLGADQQANLQRELGLLDAQMQNAQLRQSGINNQAQTSLGFGNLALGRDSLAQQGQLGNRGLDLQALAAELANRRFYDDLGFQAWDRDQYWQRN